MIVKDLVKRVDELLEMGQQTKSTQYHSQYGGDWVDIGSMTGFRSTTLSFIDRVYGKEHPHFEEFKKNQNSVL